MAPPVKFVVLIQNIFSQRDWDRFDCEMFEKNGLEILPIQVLFGYDGAEHTLARPHHQSLPLAKTATSERELDALFSTLSPNDIVLCAIPFNKRLYWVYRVLGKHRLRYATLSANSFEGHRLTWAGTTRSLREYVSLKIEDLKSLTRRLLQFLSLRLDPRLGYWSAPAPTWWLRGGDKHEYLTCYFPKCRKAQEIPAHSFNYETALGVNDDRNELFPGQHKGGYIVFQDQALVDHPDYAAIHNKLAGIKTPATPDVYYPSLRRFFSRLESETGFNVVVAACPKANYTSERNPFHRPTFFGETAYLTKHSEFVACTTTTAISFAVIWNKPVLFFTTDQIESSKSLLGDTLRMAASLKGKCINIDHLDESVPIEIPLIDRHVYDKYMRNYIKEPCSPDKSMWEIFFQAALGRSPRSYDRPTPTPSAKDRS